MRAKIDGSFQTYFKAILALAITICMVRLYEYFSIAAKSFVNRTFYFELAGLVYDIWACLIYSLVFGFLFLLLTAINKRLATGFLHMMNTLFIILYL